MNSYTHEDLLQEIAILAEDALYNDEGHHKQWYLEKIFATALNMTVEELKETIAAEFAETGDEMWEPGIAP